jgi:hypothetical protein
MMNITYLSVMLSVAYAKCHIFKCYAKCHYAERYSAICHYAKCCGARVNAKSRVDSQLF